MQDVGTTMFSGIVIAFISSWLTVQISLHRFRTERWWEKKAEAYSKIIEALHNAKTVSSAYMSTLTDATQLTEEQKKVLSIRNQAATEEILKAMDVGAFLLSEEALDRLWQYQKDAGVAAKEISWDSYLEKDLDATGKGLRDMIIIAKKDLEVSPRFLDFFRRLCRKSDNVV
jgi:hypothetical protein